MAELVRTNSADLLTCVSAPRDTAALLRPESWGYLAHAPVGGDYATGWVVRPRGILWHTGSNLLWYSEMAFSSSSGISAVAAANFAASESAVDRAPQEAGLAVVARN